MTPGWSRPFVTEPKDHGNESTHLKPRINYLALSAGLVSTSGLAVQVWSVLQSWWMLLAVSAWLLLALYATVVQPRSCSLVCLFLSTGLWISQLVLLEARPEFRTSLRATVPVTVSIGLSFVQTVLWLNTPLRDPVRGQANISRPHTPSSSRERSPEDSLTFWQWMTVSWVSPLITTCRQRQIEDTDVWQLPYEFQHAHLHQAFHLLKGSVVRRLLRANLVDLLLLSGLAVLELAAKYSLPLLLQLLLQAMQNIEHSKRPAIGYAVLILVVRVVASQSSVFSLWYGRRAYERSRGEMITMLYQKTLNRKMAAGLQETDQTQEGVDRAGDDAGDDVRETTPLLNNKSAKTVSHDGCLHKLRATVNSVFTRRHEPFNVPKRHPTSVGKLLNLMRNDVYEVAQRFWEFQSLVNKPLGLIVSTVLIWRLLGWPCLVGIAVIVFAQVANAFFSKVLLRREKIRRAATDVRLQETSQYIEAVRHLRWYGWHHAWLKKIMEARQTELNQKIITNLLTTGIQFTNTFASAQLPVAAFFAYTVFAKHRLTVDIAFPALQIFVMLRNDLRELPSIITMLLNASVAVGRIETFMNEPDKNEQYAERVAIDDCSVELRGARFAWPGAEEDVLRELSVSFPVGLTVVSGPVAAGKTALLQALLGELDLKEGQVLRSNFRVGYCAQNPWLQSMSIRDNILFSSGHDVVRYKQVLEVCELLPDLAAFQNGDLSHIGENGIGLSGGQKARVALARAIYSDAPVLLLDDPLSALDHQTAESIVGKCLKGPLVAGRTIVLVTHRVDLCRDMAVQAIELSRGRVKTCERMEPATPAAKRGLLQQSATATRSVPLSRESEGLEATAVPDKFEEEEHRAHGGVLFSVYWEYVKAGKLRWWALVLFSAVLSRLFLVGQSWLLKEWGEAYKQTAEPQHVRLRVSRADLSVRSSPLSTLFEGFPDPAVNVHPWLLAYFLTMFVYTLSGLVVTCAMLVVTYTAGKNMFAAIMDRVSGTTFRFYDITPIGRLMNRLTSDVGTIDGNISDQFLEVVWQAVAWISSIVVFASVTPTFLVFSLALTVAFVLVFLQFLPASQSLRRLEMVSLSPLISNFGTLLDGLTTVRAFRAENEFLKKVILVTDTFQKMDHFYWSVQAWLMYRFDALSACSTFLLTLLAIRSGLSPGLTAFVLVSAGKFVDSTHGLCRQYGRLQLNFVSVERIVELLHLEQEQSASVEPPAWWPSHGSEIKFDNVSIRYAPHLDPALSEVSLRLKGGTNTALIGRTGSGKSTLALALLATVLPESGKITIDGLDIAQVNRHALRSRVTFLAQEPMLFPGTLRHNLDPVQQHSDQDCEKVIARVCGSYGWTLDTSIAAGGKNLSQGQRQLVGLARAILRQSAVVIMDEATASIDMATSMEIQRVLRHEMQESTVLTIAHRSSAVQDADGCVILSRGRVVGQGSPDELEMGAGTSS